MVANRTGRAGAAPDCAARAGEKRRTRLAPVPVVDLPLGATEDRVVGALDSNARWRAGRRRSSRACSRARTGLPLHRRGEPARGPSRRPAARRRRTGENVVEREGLSIRHPARFVLVGSGNPEEGELRPQLLRPSSPLVDVRTPTDIPTRIEVVRRRDAFERESGGLRGRLGTQGQGAAPQDCSGAQAAAGGGRPDGGAGARSEALPGARHGRAARRTHAERTAARARRARRGRCAWTPAICVASRRPLCWHGCAQSARRFGLRRCASAAPLAEVLGA